MPATPRIVRAELPNGAIVRVEATQLSSSEQDVDFDPTKVFKLDGVSEALEGIASAMVASFQKIRPRNASVEFNLQIGVEAGQLTALIVKGSGTASLKVVLEW